MTRPGVDNDDESVNPFCTACGTIVCAVLCGLANYHHINDISTIQITFCTMVQIFSTMVRMFSTMVLNSSTKVSQH